MGDIATQDQKRTVVVTGFGPFASHSVNASWVAVREMERSGGLGAGVNLVTVEVPVSYDIVSELIPQLWKIHKPVLMVHVGVSGIAKELTLEQLAHNDGYDKFDVRGTVPTTGCCCLGAAQCLTSQIDMEMVCEAVRKSGCGVNAVLSFDPGRYLCDFIYFTSLNINRSCSAFVHVPPLNQPYTPGQLADALRIAIDAMLAQLEPAASDCTCRH